MDGNLLPPFVKMGKWFEDSFQDSNIDYYITVNLGN